MPKADVIRLHLRAFLLSWICGLALVPLFAEVASGAETSPVPPATPGRVEVAVFPFRVNSARPLDHLERSLPDLLRTKLEATGRVAVRDPAMVRDRAGARVSADPTDTTVRAVSSELGVRHGVTGSLTELAGRFSLDARIVATQPGVASQSIVLTAANEDELQERVGELAERIAALVATDTKPPVIEVRIEGVEDFPASVREKLSTRTGQPYEPALSQADLATLKSVPGVATASVEAERKPAGIVVVFKLVPTTRLLGGAAAGAAAAPPAERVAEVRIRGNRRIEADAIRARISTKPGEPYNPQQVAADVREVFGLGFFRNVKVLTEETKDGRVLTFDVEENPVVRQIAISGNDNIAGDKIRDALTLTTGATLDYPLLYENVARIEGLYRSEGYYQAKVHQRVEPLPQGAVSVTFEVDEGEKLRLAEIRFEGNDAFETSDLTSRMKTEPWHFYSYVTQYLDKSGTYSEPVFMQDLRGVEQKYTDAGYLQVELSEPRVDVEKDGLVVTVAVKEGPRFSVGKIAVKGDSNADIQALQEMLSLKEGAIFNRSFLTADVDSLTRHYTDRGYYFASVSPKTDMHQSSQIVDVEFEVQRGPLYFVKEVGISGNTNTRDNVVRREVQIVEGQLYSARAIDTSKRRLKGLGYFEDVTFEPKQTDYPNQLDLDVKVVEKPTGSLSFGAGYSTQDSFILTGALAESNLFGRGYAAQLSADIGGRTDRFFLSFSDPYFLGSGFSLGTTIYLTQLEYEDFEERRRGIDISVGHALSEDNTARAFATYGFNQRQVVENVGVSAASVIFRELLGDQLSTSMLGLSARIERVDDRIAPRSGYQAAGGIEYAGLGGFTNFLRAEGRGAYYLPAPQWFPLPSTFMFGARAGYTAPFNSISDFDFTNVFIGTGCAGQGQTCPINLIDSDLVLPLTERYFLGGLGTFQLRGYRSRSVGPRRSILYAGDLGGFLSGAFGATKGVYGPEGPYTPVGRNAGTGECIDGLPSGVNAQGDGDGLCNSITDKKISEFADLDETDVIGGNKFVSLSVEYRFPISETLGLMGIVFLDAGGAFAENDSLFANNGEWRYGAGFGGLWFSPFGPLQAFMGFPLNPLSVEDSYVFEFSVGGANF
ncbi:MAG: outer membrane protein assembly factor BamA [Deltaproteobacteria bacterium]|nr:outer membrane protein assembly factor BamA [Deltaproteobacteria bacterium]